MSKRESILKTAARLFATQGFDATTTIQLAREAGATEPLIYYHFKGKDDLFTRIIEATLSEYFSRIDALEKNPDSPLPRQFIAATCLGVAWQSEDVSLTKRRWKLNRRREGLGFVFFGESTKRKKRISLRTL
jgi:AcrR family transcriptional regulator